MHDHSIDLRSDTVTQPTAAMRRAMAAAEVGDDVYGEDPTVNRLEERAAELLGREAAVYVPSGTMGNQVAIHVHSRPGTEVVAEAGAHVLNFEMGAMAALSGALPRAVPTADGLLTPAMLERAIQPAAGYRTPTSLIVLENSHNLAGGRVTTPARMAELTAVAHRNGLPVHLDGARIHNAAAALGVTAAELAAGCDTVMFCLSKGLGAPVGSVLVGSAELIAEARRVRKMFGGGMRQAGVIAAAGLVALDEVLPLLAEDNRRAHDLALGLAEIPGIVLDPATVETNIVFFRLAEGAGPSAAGLASRLAEAGLRCHPLGGDSIRMVTHYHIGDEDVRRAVAITARAMKEK
ncbi:MAG: aminotransferase class I/II-fold pyridoxal phosphate-dependent enzyme [Thermoanaerobaculales bacterium]|nr:aminotransferase class I/II-fold pyridoxal phosphate-dependent enzyme [Thermoanaerobaculales bacterium]